MKINVDRAKCQNHGQCAISAPDHFELDGSGELRYQDRFSDQDRSEVEDAADSCPVQAITLAADPGSG